MLQVDTTLEESMLKSLDSATGAIIPPNYVRNQFTLVITLTSLMRHLTEKDLFMQLKLQHSNRATKHMLDFRCLSHPPELH